MKMHDKMDSWASAFDNAEFEPSAQLWERVELGLAKSANNGFKKRLLFFKLLAAASVSLAAVVGGISLYNVVTEQKVDLSVEQVAVDTEDENSVNIVERPKKESNQRVEKEELMALEREDSNTGSVAVKTENKRKSKVEKTNSIQNNETLVGDKSDVLPNAVSTERVKTKEKLYAAAPASIEKLDADLGQFEGLASRDLTMVPRLEHLYGGNEPYNKTWVGINMAMGQNNPSVGSGNTEALANYASQDGLQTGSARLSEEESAGVISAGFTVGHQLEKRWIVESGLSFIKRSTLAESNLGVSTQGRFEAVNSLTTASRSGDFILTDSYEIKNTYNSISVPLQAGYILLDKKLDIIVKAGVANEILLWNRVEDTSGNLNDQVVSSGQDSQYNTYLLSGLVSSEFSYLLGDRYLVSLAPQLRKSVNSVTKTEVESASRPLVFTIGFRFNYFLK